MLSGASSSASLFLVALLICQQSAEVCKRFGKCKGIVTESNITTYEINCNCHKHLGFDVSMYLSKLGEATCPMTPYGKVYDLLDESILTMINCSVKNEVFPIKLLRILRRTRKFKVNVVGATVLRLDSDRQNQDKVEPIIEATFKHSSILGMGPGWFNKGASLSLKIENCSFDVLESQFISGYNYEEATVNIQMKRVDITTIKELAFSLPRNGSLSIKWGKIHQWETLAYEGGEVLHLNGNIIGSIQEKAISVKGLREFKLENSTVGQIQSSALVEYTSGHNYDDVVQSVLIRRNRIIKLDPKAFSAICPEKSFVFEENIIRETNFQPSFTTMNCRKQKDWNTSLLSNIMHCENCINSDSLTEQVCAFYKTVRCLCMSQDNETVSNRTTNRQPCLESFYDFLSSECPSQNDEIIIKCQIPVVNLSGELPNPNHNHSGDLSTNYQIIILSLTLFTCCYQFSKYKSE